MHAKEQRQNTADRANAPAGNNTGIRTITGIALMAAVLSILGPVSVPIGPVPISLTNLTIYLFLYVLGAKEASAAYLIYMLLGLAGLPVFSGYTGGAVKLFGPTGGYLIGFLPMAYLGGLAIRKYWKNPVFSVLLLEAVTWIPYLLGTAWLAFSAKMTFRAALMAGVVPFILIDLAKIVVCAAVGPVIRDRLQKAGVLPV